jgi:hypothetical protein
LRDAEGSSPFLRIVSFVDHDLGTLAVRDRVRGNCRKSRWF